MAYLRLDKDNRLDDKWKDEMEIFSSGLADQDYFRKLEQEVPGTAQYLLDHGVKLNHYDEQNALLAFNTNQRFVSPEGGGLAVINSLFSHFEKFDNVDIIWETMAERLLTTEQGEACGVKVRRPDGKMGTSTARR
jgi:tricarballylate dehydrogenase